MAIDTGTAQRIVSEGDYIKVDRQTFEAMVAALGDIRTLTNYADSVSKAFQALAPTLAMMAPGMSLPTFKR